MKSIAKAMFDLLLSIGAIVIALVLGYWAYTSSLPKLGSFIAVCVSIFAGGVGFVFGLVFLGSVLTAVKNLFGLGGDS